MSELVAIAYDDEFKAEEVRLTLAKMQKEHLIELEDAAIVIKNAEGKVKLNQAINLTAAGAASGSFWGLLIGTLFLC
ncbi:membrane protein, partial [Crocosphaera watsonii]